MAKLITKGKPEKKVGSKARKEMEKWKGRFICPTHVYKHRPNDHAGCGAEFTLETQDLYYIEPPNPRGGFWSYSLYAQCPHCHKDVYYDQCPMGNMLKSMPSKKE